MLRTALVVLQSRQVGDHILHPSGVHADLRDQMMRAKFQEDLYDVLDWLYALQNLAGASSTPGHRGRRLAE